MDLSIIIVNWNSVQLLRSCLNSILATPINFQFEILVIDNASYDGVEAMITREFPSVRFIQAHENLGFAGGNNLAFASATGRNILFLNPDTELVDDAIPKMMAVLDAKSDAGVVGPRLVNPDLSPQVETMRALPTVLNELLDSAITRRVFQFTDLWGVRPVIQGTKSTIPAEMLPGTCIMLRREVFEAAGKFNNAYFMYAEDVELSYRARQGGWTNYYIGDALVVHHGGCSSRQKSESYFSTVMMRESVWKFLCISRGEVYANIYRLTTALAALVRIALSASAGVLAPGSHIRERARYSMRKWVKVLRWCIGLEGWAHEYRPAPASTKAVPMAGSC